MFGSLIRHGLLPLLLLLTALTVGPVVADCVCMFQQGPGVRIVHCAVVCDSSLQSCACGIISSQCRCCPIGHIPSNPVEFGIGRAICTYDPAY